VIVLDTHALVWALAGDGRLGRKAARLVERALSSGGVFVSAMSFWEVGMLVAKGRLRLPAEELRAEALKRGVVEVPVGGTIAITAAKLGGLHGDPADRLIVSTALDIDARLATGDDALLGWRGGLKTLDART
jgi:PIN domain nuclease of toxin-antitoxin system